jgi:hypothetical protein
VNPNCETKAAREWGPSETSKRNTRTFSTIRK